jgi:hypothetical protein
MAEEWYYANGGQQHGPVSIVALRELAHGGALQASDLVWTAGMSDWTTAGVTRGLFPKAVQVAPPEPPQVPSPEAKPALERTVADRYRERSFDRSATVAKPFNTSAKVAVAVVVVAVLGLTALLAVAVIIAIDAFDSKSRRSQRFVIQPNPNGNGRFKGRNFAPPPAPHIPQIGDPRVLPPAKEINSVPDDVNSYEIQLTGKGATDRRKIYLEKGVEVTIRVKTTQWPADQPPPDVDLYLCDTKGKIVELDIDPSMDCMLKYIPDRSDTYIIEVELCDGTTARCTVSH